MGSSVPHRILNDDDIKKYILPAIRNIEVIGLSGDWMTGFNRIAKACNINILDKLSEGQKRVLKGIAGPHGMTILLALEANKK